MKILFDWLKEFVPIDVPLDVFIREMTLAGVAVDAVSEAGGSPLLELEITTNRPDLLSHYGVAREGVHAALLFLESRAHEEHSQAGI